MYRSTLGHEEDGMVLLLITNGRSDGQLRQLKEYTFETPSNIAVIEDALISKTTPKLKASFELRARLALMVCIIY